MGPGGSHVDDAAKASAAVCLSPLPDGQAAPRGRSNLSRWRNVLADKDLELGKRESRPFGRLFRFGIQ